MFLRFYLFVALLVFTCQAVDAQRANPYGLSIINDVPALLRTVELDSNKAFVEITDYAPTIALDIKYATTQNVFYTQLYKQPRAYVRLPVAKALAAVQTDLASKGVGLKVYDAYRPYSVTCQMFEMLPDTVYMGLPRQGSRHNRGVALDLTLIDLKTGNELRMPTPFDALVYASHPNFDRLPADVIRNRDLLKTTMQAHGFTVDPVEWWHYNYKTKTTFELLDLSFDEIAKTLHRPATKQRSRRR
ncbi:M15 family metallopeptidase [uncultured Spirosoma sp.]|uniref:M15 family metallopeptidase n=1 Tax=uncultured Spirosoma sp. TaxID=278208 RepID=UPI00258C24E0|nr:M15 family metallopeptidase [uncultured Spirosoma sp.]